MSCIIYSRERGSHILRDGTPRKDPAFICKVLSLRSTPAAFYVVAWPAGIDLETVRFLFCPGDFVS